MYAKIGADTSDFLRSMDGVKKEVGAFEKTANLVASGTKLALGVGAAAIGGLAGGIGLATKAAMDMEQQVANIKATMGLTADQTEQLNGLITDLGLDPQLKVSAVEAANAIEMLGKNGLTMDQIMAGAAKSSVLLANATNDDFAMAADVATDVMQQFNIDAADMGRAVDGIIGVTQASKFGLEDYALAIAQAGGVAGAVGVDYDDFNAVIAATSSSFASGSDAGTSFKTFLQRLVPQTDKAEDALDQLGIMAGGNGVAGAFFDASGQMRSMSEIAQALQTATMDLSEAQKIEAFSTIFGTDAMRTAFALAEAGGGTIDSLKAIIGNVSAEEAAATRMDTFAGSLEVFSGVMETLTIQIGQAFLPIAREIVEWVTGLAQTYGPGLIAWVQDVVARVTEMASGWGHMTAVFEDGSGILADILQFFGMGKDAANAIGQAIFGIKEAAVGAFTWLADNVGSWVSWKDALAAVALILTTMAIPAIMGFLTAVAPLAGLILLIAGLRTAWERDWGGIQEKTQAVFDYLSNLFGPFIETVTKFGGDALQEIIDWVTGTDTEFTALKAIWESAKATAKQFWDDLVGVVSNLYATWTTRIGEWGKAAWDWIVQMTPIALAKLGEWGAALWGWLVENVPIWVEKLGQWGKAAWQWIVDASGPALTKLGEWGGALLKWLVDGIPEWIAQLLKWGTALYTWIGDAIPGAINKLADFVASLRQEGDGNALQSFVDMAMGWAKALWAWIENDLLPVVGPEFQKFIAAMANYGLELLTAVGRLAKELGLLLWEWIVDITPVAVQKLGEWGQRLWDWISNNAPGWARQLGTWAKEIWQWIVDSWPTVKEKLGDWARNVWDWIKDTAPKVGDWFKDMGASLLQGLWDGIRNGWNAMTGWFQDAWEGLKRSFKSFFGIASPSKVFMEFGQNIGEGFNLGVSASMSDTPQVLTDAVMGGNSYQGATYNNTTTNTFNLSMAGATGDQATDLRANVTRLAALYA